MLRWLSNLGRVFGRGRAAQRPSQTYAEYMAAHAVDRRLLAETRAEMHARPQTRTDATFPPLPTLEQQRRMRERLHDFDPSHDAEVHARMLALHELMERDHR